ncbi:MAG TPA: ABC transporter permease [Terriglobales bacterium]|nr:ABC transporter permease [Terriglobales bacterium]
MQIFFDIVGQTLRTLWAHKLRSFLTMFGIAWGVGSLLLLVGLGEGFRSGQRKNLATLGTDIMFLFPGRVPAVEGSLNSGRYYRLRYADYEAIRKEAKHVRAVTPNLNRGDIRAVSEYTSASGAVSGVAPVFNTIRFTPIATGRWLSEQDNNENRRVAVLSYDMQRTLFPGRPAVGNTILLNGTRFDVIGAMDQTRKGGQGGPDLRIFVPINTMRAMFPMKGDNAEDAISFINYQPSTRQEHEIAKLEVHRIIARRHQFDASLAEAFDDWDTIESAKRVDKIFDAMDWFLGAVGLVTLALGAIGIINIMLVSVTERVKEIGLRKALGATNRNILTQFFLEGVFLTAFSGCVGLAITIGFVALLSLAPTPRGFDTPRIVPISAAVAIGSLALAGVVAGLYPARKAAMLPPVEALRQE